MPTMHVVLSLDHASCTWQRTTTDWDDILQVKNPPRAQYVFISSKDTLFSPDQVSAEFKIPALMFDRVCLESNGFCGRRPILDSNGHLEVYNNWSRFLIKQT